MFIAMDKLYIDFYTAFQNKLQLASNLAAQTIAKATLK